MQVSLLQFECIACVLHDVPPTAPSSLEKFPPLFSPLNCSASPPHASRQLSAFSPPSPCAASSSSSGRGRPWKPCGSPSSQVWCSVTAVPPFASPQAGPASPSSVLIIKTKVEIKLHRCHPTASTVSTTTATQDCEAASGSRITALSADMPPLRGRRTEPCYCSRTYGVAARNSCGAAAGSPQSCRLSVVWNRLMRSGDPGSISKQPPCIATGLSRLEAPDFPSFSSLPPPPPPPV